jgi:hypothetical protein
MGTGGGRGVTERSLTGPGLKVKVSSVILLQVGLWQLGWLKVRAFDDQASFVLQIHVLVSIDGCCRDTLACIALAVCNRGVQGKRGEVGAKTDGVACGRKVCEMACIWAG